MWRVCTLGVVPLMCMRAQLGCIISYASLSTIVFIAVHTSYFLTMVHLFQCRSDNTVYVSSTSQPIKMILKWNSSVAKFHSRRSLKPSPAQTITPASGFQVPKLKKDRKRIYFVRRPNRIDESDDCNHKYKFILSSCIFIFHNKQARVSVQWKVNKYHITHR